MNIKDLYNPHIIKRGRIGLTKPFAFFLAVIILVTGIIGTLVFVVPMIGTRLSGRNYYILTLGTSTNLVVAEGLSQRVKNGGGGGFIINDGIFHVSAAAYLDRGSAETVAGRMDGFETGIFIVNIPRVRVREFNNRADNRALMELLVFPIDLIDFVIYQNSRLDTGETSDSAVTYLLANRAGAIRDNIVRLENLMYQHYDNQFLINILEFYLRFLYDFYYMVSITSGDGLLTHRLKYFVVKYILEYNGLILR